MTFFWTDTAGSATPDSEADQKLAHRWLLDDLNGSVADSIAGEDGAVNGVSAVDGPWAGESAGQGDGTDDYIAVSPLSTFTQNLDTNCAIGFSISFTSDDDGNTILGVRETTDDQIFAVGQFVDPGVGELGLFLRDDSGNDVSVRTDSSFNDGSEYRFVINKTGNSASDVSIWANQSEQITTNSRDDGISSFSSMDNDLFLFATNDEGSGNSHFDGIIDDICLFSDSLTQSEIESYSNPWV